MKITELLESKAEFLHGKDGKPLVLYRGLASDAKSGIPHKALKGRPRKGYATFLSSSPHVASSYANPGFHDIDDHSTGAVVPVHVKATKLIEFPTTIDKLGYKSFNKFEFDRRAQLLKPGEVLVARGVYDYGPRANPKVDPEKLYSYASDVYAVGKGTIIVSAIRRKKITEAVNLTKIYPSLLSELFSGLILTVYYKHDNKTYSITSKLTSVYIITRGDEHDITALALHYSGEKAPKEFVKFSRIEIPVTKDTKICVSQKDVPELIRRVLAVFKDDMLIIYGNTLKDALKSVRALLKDVVIGDNSDVKKLITYLDSEIFPM